MEPRRSPLLPAALAAVRFILAGIAGGLRVWVTGVIIERERHQRGVALFISLNRHESRNIYPAVLADEKVGRLVTELVAAQQIRILYRDLKITRRVRYCGRVVLAAERALARRAGTYPPAPWRFCRQRGYCRNGIRP